MKTTDTNDTVRMLKILILYHTILGKNGFTWLPKSNSKVSVKHYFRPDVLRNLRTYVLKRFHKDLKNDLTAFMKQTVHLAEESQLLDSVTKTDTHSQKSDGCNSHEKV